MKNRSFAGVILATSLLVVSLSGCAYTTTGITESTPEGSITKELHGTYVGNFLGMEESMTFKGDTVTIQSDFGKQICKYFIPGGLESGQVIDLTDVATGEKTTRRFKYNVEYDCFVLDYEPGSNFDTSITYYRGR